MRAMQVTENRRFQRSASRSIAVPSQIRRPDAVRWMAEK
jgi:hypothetical protein